MWSGKSLVRRLVIVWAGILAALGCNNEYDESERSDFTLEVLECEEAYARLERCCPGFRIEKREGSVEFASLCVDFEYEDRKSIGCDGYSGYSSGHLRPSLTRAESQCIVDATCEWLEERSVCERAKDLKPRGATQNSNYSYPHESSNTRNDLPPVCP